jgi:hypothetical protein
MGAAWFVSPLNVEFAAYLDDNGVAHPPPDANAAGPSPRRVFEALAAFPEYTQRVRRRERPRGKGQVIDIELRRADGSYAIEINLLRVTDDDRPALFCFAYYRETEELVRIVRRLAATCGPLVLWHDSGEEPILVTE